MPAAEVDIPYYLDYLPQQLLAQLWQQSEAVDAVAGLRVAAGLRRDFPNIESDEALQFVCGLYENVKYELDRVLQKRQADRTFIDQQTAECTQRNSGRDYLAPAYETVIGKKNDAGEVVVGSLLDESADTSDSELGPAVEIPDFVKGFQVTLFGPPDSAKMAINAMNALNRVPTDEPEIVTRLVASSGSVPRWGADNEDSQTPIMANFLSACENLIGCFDGSLSFEDANSGKSYQLDKTGRSIPIKRIPGLALPDGNHLLNGNPLPLHLFDFAMHIFHNWSRPEALLFYIPKLENEFEAAYFKGLIQAAEAQIKKLHPEYQTGSVRLFIVFENPRAIFRIREIARTLHPYFLGGSLGWHDFLGSTARLFKHDPNYRIPVKADPNIVINHIRESHHLLVDALAPIGGIRIGGMYGVLYEDNNPESYKVSIVGFIKDVVTQLKRGLTGYWVAHPAFVRTGIALVEAYQQSALANDFSAGDAATGIQDVANSDPLRELVRALVPDEVECNPLLDFIFKADIPGLDRNDPLYERGVLAASIRSSEVISNDDPDEVRYNIFQAIQYLTDWLCGNGCVALPAAMKNAKGESVFVRIMDDLATTERYRWELWAEIFHGRVTLETFNQILAEEIEFIRTGKTTGTKRTQVAWTEQTARWYPIAEKLLRQLVVDPNPVEFATELLMPFTFSVVRDSENPWQTVNQLCPGKYLP